MATIPLPALHIAPQQEQPGPLDAYAKLLQLRNLQAQGQTQQLNQTALSQENQQRALQLQDQQTLRSLAPNHIKKDSDGNVTGFDMPGLLNEAAGKQVNPNTLTQMGNQYSESVKNLAASNEATRNNELAKNKASYELLESVRSLKDPTQQQQAYQQGLPKLQKLGIDISKMPPQAPTDPAAFDAAEATLGMHAQALADAKTVSETQANAAKVTAANTGAQRLNAEMPGGPLNRVTQDISIATNPQIQAGKIALATAEGKARAQAQAGLLTGDALDQSADRYLQTGQLPAGMRSPGMAAAIINRAGERGAGQSIPANSAAYKANLASYENVTKTLDTLSGFESAAIKNIDMFKGLAQKLPDSGVPWLNTPLRNLDEKAVGAEWMPAINAARQIANREVARVTNDPKLSGVLSDSARGEVNAINPADATMNQILHVTDTMKQDMANVHTSLAAQKEDIGKRLGIKATPASETAPPKTAAPAAKPAAATHTGVGSVDKKKHWLDAQGNDLGLAE